MSQSKSQSNSQESFITILKRTCSNRALLMAALMGAAAGLPLLLTKSTLKTWLRAEGVDLATIGFFSLAGLPYTLKFLWAPLVDSFCLQKLGRRRTWLILSQSFLVIGLVLLSFLEPSKNISFIAFAACFIAFFSATQDTVIDAYRRETLTDEELGLGSTLYVYGYRIAMWISRVIPLVVAGAYGWQMAYLSMAAVMSLNLIVSVLAKEPEVEIQLGKEKLPIVIIRSFREFFVRLGVKQAVLILLFILFYKLGDSYASVQTSPFYVDLGFSLGQIGLIDGSVGFFAQFIGLMLGSIVILKIGINSSLWFFGFLQMISTAGFALMNEAGANLMVFAGVLAFENISGGMGTAAFLAFMASLTNKSYTATQYALMTSLMAVPLNIIGSTSGLLIENAGGWTNFFLISTFMAIPGLIFLHQILKLQKDSDSRE